VTTWAGPPLAWPAKSSRSPQVWSTAGYGALIRTVWIATVCTSTPGRWCYSEICSATAANSKGHCQPSQSYRKAKQLFDALAVPRRAAQVELSLAVVDEMSGRLQPAARRYEELAEGARLSARDRTRSRLWVGTAVSKEGDNAYASRMMDESIEMFERLEEPEDWSVAHQKLALAHRGAGDLGKALHFIDVALANRSTDSPMQRVRLDTAHAHILLSDSATSESGLHLLDQAATTSQQYGMSHQFVSIRNIRRAFERAS
jgi:tetratricopeptide (TPR) repeat protein